MSKNKTIIKCMLITILTSIVFIIITNYMFSMSMRIENYQRHILRILIIAFFTISISTPIIINIKEKNNKDLKKYIKIIFIFYMIGIVIYWTTNVINEEQRIKQLNGTAIQTNISEALEKKIEQEQLLANIMEQTKTETYKEYIIKAMIEIVIVAIGIGLQRKIILNKGET